jgi:histidinol dehydrogenase
LPTHFTTVRLLQSSSKTFDSDLAEFCRGAAVPKDIRDAVTSILADIQQRGDEAVCYYAAKFDGAKLRARDFRVKPAEIAAAVKRLPAAERKALVAAHENIVAFNKQSLPKDWMGKNKHGADVGEINHPIRRVGLYVPGGEVPLVSTVLMTATLAKIAGCPEIAVFTPSNSQGKIADGLLAALDLISDWDLAIAGSRNLGLTGSVLWTEFSACTLDDAGEFDLGDYGVAFGVLKAVYHTRGGI